MRSLRHHRRALTAGLVLAVLLFRAYVPLGFMPASGTPFLLQLCPAGPFAQLPAQHLHNHAGQQHPGGHTHVENCPYGSAPAAAPVSQFVTFAPAGLLVASSPPHFSPLLAGAQLPRAHRARAPPSPA
jgi:hypothetical protein